MRAAGGDRGEEVTAHHDLSKDVPRILALSLQPKHAQCLLQPWRLLGASQGDTRARGDRAATKLLIQGGRGTLQRTGAGSQRLEGKVWAPGGPLRPGCSPASSGHASRHGRSHGPAAAPSSRETRSVGALKAPARVRTELASAGGRALQRQQLEPPDSERSDQDSLCSARQVTSKRGRPGWAWPFPQMAFQGPRWSPTHSTNFGLVRYKLSVCSLPPGLCISHS